MRLPLPYRFNRFVFKLLVNVSARRAVLRVVVRHHDYPSQVHVSGLQPLKDLPDRACYSEYIVPCLGSSKPPNLTGVLKY